MPPPLSMGGDIISVRGAQNTVTDWRSSVLGSSAPPWTPADLGAKLEAWFEPKPSGVVLDSDDNIATLLDLTGHGYDAVPPNAGQAPAFHATGGLNGHGWIDSDPVRNTGLTFGKAVPAFPDGFEYVLAASLPALPAGSLGQRVDGRGYHSTL